MEEQVLLDRIDYWREKANELEVENRSLRDKLEDSEYRIRNELEPIIESKKRAYDSWATSPERH